MSNRTSSDIQAELAQARAAMTETVNELTGRLDPRTQASAWAQDAKDKIIELWNNAKAGDSKAIAILGSAGAFTLLFIIGKLRRLGK